MAAHIGPLLLSLERGFPLFLLCLLTFLLSASQRAHAAGDYLGVDYLTCMRNATSLSTTFASNRDTALRNLTTLSSQGTKYATTTEGSGAGMVYAMFQCRGDQTLQLCRECMQNATARLPQRDCPHSVGARIQLDGCYLRYDNQSFFKLNTSFILGLCSGAQTTDVAVLTGIEAVMANVTSLAPKQGGFASAVSTSGGQYALAQCLGYLSESECSNCLSLYNYSSVCKPGALGGRLYLTSCFYRYETYSFFEGAPAPPPLPPPAASPVPSSLPLPPPLIPSAASPAPASLPLPPSTNSPPPPPPPPSVALPASPRNLRVCVVLLICPFLLMA